MWPKVIAQLFELLPHVSRLIPVADRFFSSKAAAEKANEAALAAMAEGVRGDLGQVTKAHAGLYRQLQELSAQVAEVGKDVKRGQAIEEVQENRLAALEEGVGAIGLWVKLGVSLVVAMLAVCVPPLAPLWY